MGTENKGTITMVQYPHSPRCQLLIWAALVSSSPARQLSVLLLLFEKGTQRPFRVKSHWDSVSDYIFLPRNLRSFIQIKEARNEQEKKRNVPRTGNKERVLSDEKIEKRKKDKEKNWLVPFKRV